MAVAQTIVRFIRVGVPIRKIVPSDLLSDLADVLIDSLQDGDILVYDSDISKWKNTQQLPDNLFFNEIDGGTY